MTTVGSIVGSRYRLERRIAQGGMGEVWQATHVSLLAPVAIKFMKPGAGDERFLREARIAAALRHPNVVALIDEGTTADGQLFLVMEYLEGMSLAMRASQTPALTVRQVCEVMSEVLRALQVVHAKGIVHRDLKPDNVFLLTEDDDDERARVKLLDFGVAHACLSSALALPLSNLTTTGCTVGTPWYMAPEQARGLTVGPAADLFSIGVMLYRTITGRFPFEGATLADIVLKLVTTPPIPPHEYRPELPERLSNVILRALAVAPEDRFPDARAMRRALAACRVPHLPAAVLERPLEPSGVDVEPSQPALAPVSVSAQQEWAAPEPLRRSTLPETPSGGLPLLRPRPSSVSLSPLPPPPRPRVARAVAAAVSLAAAATALALSGGGKPSNKVPAAAIAAEATRVTPAADSANVVQERPVAEVTEATPNVLPASVKPVATQKRILRPFRNPGF